MVGLRAWACRIQGLRTRNLQQGLGSSVNCLAVWRLLWLLYPPLQGSHHWVTRPHPRIPQPLPSPTLPRVELGGNDRKELFPRLPLSASRTHFIFHTFDLFLSTWEGGQKSQALGIQVNVCPLKCCETFWGGIVRRQIRFRRTGLPVSVHRYQVLLLGRSPLGMTVHILVFGICNKSLEAQCSAQNLP